MKILVLNAGSSSLKCALYDLSPPLPEQAPASLWEGKLEWGATTALRVKNVKGESVSRTTRAKSHRDAAAHLLDLLWSGEAGAISGPEEIAAAGHRVVHGGRDYIEPVLITSAVKATIKRLATFAPLHNPASLEGINLIEAKLPSLPQVAAFDTAFHAHLPPAAAVYPGPYQWLGQEIRRYGFHGINYEYCVERASQILARDRASLRLIVCHLGNGCSLAAVDRGRSVETTMGFTPLEGLMMGTRSGSLDPGIVTYLMRRDGLTPDEVDDLLNRKSGLLGISGCSGDMRAVLKAMNAGNSRAKLAFEIYVHRLRYYVGAMLAVLGGVDALVFTGGVGENSPEVRAAACATLGFLDLQLDSKDNSLTASDRDIATPASRVRVLVIHAQEDWAIARATWKLVHSVAAAG